MMRNMEFESASSEATEDFLSERLDAIRLSRNLTQSSLAREAGVSRSTITRLAQPGKGISLDSFIRILKALGLEAQLQALLPDPTQSPLQRLAKPEKPRQRARSTTTQKTAVDNVTTDGRGWTWSEEESKEESRGNLEEDRE